MPIENWENWRLVHSRQELPGAVIEVVNCRGNCFEATVRNARRFALWLRSEKVDFAKPVRVVVNGKDAFNGIVRPSLSTALRSVERRRDWGLVYAAEVQVTVSCP